MSKKVDPLESSRALLERVEDPSDQASLRETLTAVEELGRRLDQYESHLREQVPPATFVTNDVAELDGLANRVAMDLCSWDSSYDDITDRVLADALAAYAAAARPLMERYASVRLRVRLDVDLADTRGIDHVSATLGLETLARKEEHEYLIALWRPARDRARVAAGGRPLEVVETTSDLDGTKLRWPDQGDVRGSWMDEFDDDEDEAEDLSGTTWDDARRVLASEKEMLEEVQRFARVGDALSELPTDELDDVNLAELGPFDFGCCAAALALYAAGCPTDEASSGRVGGCAYVVFWARPRWVPLLAKAATHARVGLGNADEGAGEVFTNADDVMGLVRFASELVDMAREFDTLKQVHADAGI